MVPKNLKFRWRHERLWPGLIIYGLTATVGASFVEKHQESGWIILIMLVFISICMITERGQWKIWQRIAVVPLAWIAEAILAPFVAFTIGVLINAAGLGHLTNRGVTLFASLPFVIFAMRRSMIFLRVEHEPDPEANRT